MARVADVPVPPGTPALPSAPRRQPPFNPSHVTTLLWMRWKLTIRGYARGGTASIVGLVFMLVFLVPFIGGLAVITGIGYFSLSHGLAIQLLFGVLAALYVGWILLPLLQYTLNEGLDVTRLQIYPVTRAELMVGLVLATLFDIGTLGLIALYVPIVVGWSPTLVAGAFTVLALAFAFVHTIGISQLVLAALMGLLRSRRYRDISIVVFALLGASCSVGGQVVGRVLSFSGAASVADIRIDGYLQFTPPGMAARAIELASGGQYVEALAWLGALAALVPVLLAVWALVLDRGITAAETAGSAPSRQRGRRRARAQATGDERSNGAAVGEANGVPSAHIPEATTARRRGLLSPAAMAVAGKDARYLWRDPQLRASLLSSLFVLVVVLLPTFGTSREAQVSIPPVLFAPIPTLIVALNLSLNSLGLERQALQMLYLFPVRPLDVLWGKNLTVGALTVGVQVVLAVGLAAFTGGWIFVPMAIAVGVAGTLVLMGCGNVTSVLLPFRVREMRMGRSNLSSENGCLRAVLSMVTLFVAALLLLPVAAALIVPLVLQQFSWLAVALLVAVAYGAGLHQLATRLIAPLMLTRGPEILAVATHE
jgi:ABC-2 type transport system permease protein